MSEKAVAEPAVFARAFDQAGNVGEKDAGVIVVFDDAHARIFRRERIGRAFRPRVRERAGQRRFSRVGEADEPDVGDGFQHEGEVAASAFLAGRRLARRLVRRGLELIVPEAAASAFEQHDALAVFEELRDEQAAFRLEDLRSRGNGQEHVRAVAPVAVASRAGLAVFGVPVRLKGVAAQVALVFVADEHDVAAVPAVAAVGAALGQEFFAAEAQAAVPAVAGAQVNFRFVDEHFSERKKGAEGKRFGVIGRRRRALCRDPFF